MINITQHEGKKYLRWIFAPPGQLESQLLRMGDVDVLGIQVDIYAVLNAFQVKRHETAHAIKKLLAAGARGKGDEEADLVGAIAAINRALDEVRREKAQMEDLKDKAHKAVVEFGQMIEDKVREQKQRTLSAVDNLGTIWG